MKIRSMGCVFINTCFCLKLMNNSEIEKEIMTILDNVKNNLGSKIKQRTIDMDSEDPDSHILFKLLGFDKEESKKIDLYHNIGRLVYRSSADLMEKIVIKLFETTKNATRLRLENPFPPPQIFNIDAYVKSEKRAYEIKWKHATTDGDHVNKEMQKPKTIKKHGLIPIHLVFFTSERKNAISALDRIIKAYKSVDGEVYVGNDAFQHLHEYTGFDLKKFLFSNT
jgi:hypothetical protein